MTPLPVHGPVARFARRSLPWLLAAAFVLLALFSVGGRVLTANLDGAETRIASLLGRATGFDVVLERAEGRFLGWHPVLEAEGVSLAPPGEAPAVTLGRMRLEVDVIETLVRRHLVAETLVVEDVAVDLAPGEDGGWRLRRGRGGPAPDAEPIVSFLYHSDYVDLRRAEIRFWPDGGGTADRVELDGALVNERFDHRGHLAVRLHPADMDRSEREALGERDGVADGVLYLDLEGDPLDPRTRAGEVLLDLERVPLTVLTGRLRGGDALASGVLDRLRVRARLDPRTGLDVSARASALRLDAGPSDPVPVRNVRLDLAGEDLGTGRGDLRFRALRAVVGDEALALDDARLAWRTGDAGRRWFAELPAFEASSTVRLLLTLDVLGAGANRWIANLDPSADVLGARVHVDEARRTVASAITVRGLRLRGFRGVPTIRGADATAVLFEGGGWLDLDSGPFFLRFPEVFAEGWRYDSGRGRVNFRFGEDALHLVSDRLEIAGAAGRVSGRFGIYLPPEPSERRLTLMLGVTDADAAFTEAYLPERMETGTRGWLVDAVRAGRVPRGAVMLLSDMQREPPRLRTAALWFDLRRGRLDFDPAWPVAASLSGTVVVEPEGVRGRLEGGRIAGLEIGAMDLAVPAAEGDAPRELQLSGRGRGDGDALVDFLRRAPLGDALDFLEAGWVAAGPVDLTLDLAVPLDGSGARRVDVDADFALSGLTIPQGRLVLEDLRGALAYRHPGRLEVRGVEGAFLGGPLSVEVGGDFGGAADDGTGLEVRFTGEAAGADVARWLDVDALSRLSGRVDHGGVLRIAGDGALTVDVEVDGAGVDTGLPAPLAASSSVLAVRLTEPAGAPMTVDLDWGAVGGRFLLDAGTLVRGGLGLGVPVPELPQAGLRVRGAAETVEVGAWLDAVRAMEEDALLRGRDGGRPTLLDVGVTVADGRWGDLRFGRTRLDLAGSTRSFGIDFDAERVAGRVVLPEDEAPLELELRRLVLPLATVGSPEPVEAPATPDDPLGALDALEIVDDARPSVVERLTDDLDTAGMPDVDVRIADFSYLGEDLGRASFDLRPDPDGLRLESIDAEGRGLRFGPDAEGRARIDLRLVPTSRTHVVGRLSGEDAVAVQERFGLAPVIESDEFAFALDLAWPGPLDEPDLETTTGTIELDVERGRFVQIETGAGPLRMVGLVNLAAIARRLRLDFTDVYKRGIAFEDIDGTLALGDGMLVTEAPIRIVGPSSRFRIEGDLDLATDLLDGEMIVTLPVSSNLPWYAAYAALLANPIAGAGVFVAERIFRDQIDRFSSARYRIEGTLDDPEITFDTIFENEVTPTDGDPNPVAPAEAGTETPAGSDAESAAGGPPESAPADEAPDDAAVAPPGAASAPTDDPSPESRP